MLNKNSLNKEGKFNLPAREYKSAFVFNRNVLFGILAFIILASLSASLIYQQYRIFKQEQKKEGYGVAENAKERLQEALANSLSATRVLSFFIDQNGTVKHFDSVAAQILSTNKGIDALELVPGGIIQHVYPLQGNENVIGYNILKDSTRSKEAFRAIKKNELYFSGPYNLKQGGFGIVGRLPVFRNGRFWGFSAVVIKMATLLKAVDIDSTGKNGYYFQLSKINPVSGVNEFFIPHETKKLRDYPIYVELPMGDWKLSVQPVKENKGQLQIFIFALIGFLFSVFGGIFVTTILRRPEKLDRLVKERTSALKSSEKKYRSVVERVSDAFIALDVNWTYTYVNEKAGEILSKKPEMLIGENIWAEFPEAVHQPFYHAYHRAMQLQEYQYEEEFDPHLNKWIENHIYPSKDGLTVFFKDVTEIKQITLDLKNKEEKYRTLIEQASDGIVITDLEGVIIEVNNSIKQMIGYEEQEMIGSHLNRYLPEQDIDAKPLRINELMQGKSLLYERKLLKKDGTVIDVEINSKMATSHTLIGFIRDITERKKHENTLLYQARLLESVSDAIVSLDMNRCIVSWNKASEDLFGFTAGEVIGKRVPELISFEYPDTNNEAVFKQVFTEGEWKGEFNFIHPKSGEKIHLLSGINLLKNKAGIANGFIITSNNISDRKKVEEEIRTSKERFELIAEATNDAIWDHDFIKNETWGNKKLYNLYGLAADQKINFEMFLEHIHPDERAAILTKMKQAMDNSESSLSEIFLFKTDEGYKTFFDRAYIKYDDAANPIRILGAMQDITERERDQKALSESEAKYRTIIEQAADGIFIANGETYLMDVNSAGCLMSGYTKTELQKLKFEDVVPPEDLINNPLRITKMHKGESVTNERRLICKDGTIINVEISAQKLLDGHYQLFVRNISERKKAAEKLIENEKKLQQVLSSTVDNFYVVDVNYNVILINKVAERNLEIAWGKPVKQGYNLLDIIPEEGEEPIKENFEKAFAGENIEYEMHLTNPGLPSWVMIRFTPVYDESDTVNGVSVVARDISARKQADELLQKSYEDIRQLASNLQTIREDERTTIAREIHDELGQQLTGLKLDLLWLMRKINSSDDEIDSKMKESIDLINATIGSVRKICTDLRPSILDDLGLLPALEWHGEEFEKRSGTKVVFENTVGDFTVSPQVATGIFRIYQELLTNIARHANASLVRASISKDENRLYFSVEDNGNGVDTETIKNKKNLGLLGIKERCLLFDGTYEFVSKPGEGFVTTISVPLQIVKVKL